MSDPFARLRRFLAELKRRNVYKVAVTYAAVVFIGLQAVRLLVPATTLPGWADELLIAIAVLGFPIAIVLAWAFEVTPEGVRLTEAAEGEETGGSGAYQWIGLAVVVLLAGGVWYVTTGDGGERAAETTATNDTTAARTASTVRDTAGPPRIAVLPFENIARDTGDAFFARGMHEEVLNQLSKVSGLEVISRTSVMQYAETNKTVQEISEELGGVNALLEGTVRRAGDQVRITTQLIGAPEDEHLWSTTYDRTLTPDAVFDIQADIAGQIAGSLKTELAGEERRRIANAPTEDLAAYEAFLRGRGQVWQFWGQGTPELLDRASRNLREAVGRDSSFAEAHAWLAQAHLARIGPRSPGEAPRWLDSASAAVERARRIDPDLASVHLAQAGIYLRQDSLQAQAEALRRALTLQPNHALATTALAQNLAQRGELAEAVRMARGAVRLDPRHPAILRRMGVALEVVRLHDAADAWYRHALEIEPRYLRAYRERARNELFRGRPQRALAIWQEYFDQADAPTSLNYLFAAWAALAADRPEQAHDYLRRHLSGAYGIEGGEVSVGWPARHPEKEGLVAPGTGVTVGFTELGLGHEERGRRILRETVEALRGNTERGKRLGRPYGVFLAGALATLGHTQEALQEVERAAQEEQGWVWLKGFPFLEALRPEPRFQEIVRQVEARREDAREEIRRMGIDLYPPGAEPDTAR